MTRINVETGRGKLFFFTPLPRKFLFWDFSRVKFVMMNFRIFLQIRIYLFIFFLNLFVIKFLYDYFNTNLDFLELRFENTLLFFLLKKRILILYLKITIKNCIFFFIYQFNLNNWKTWKLIFQDNPELMLYI